MAPTIKKVSALPRQRSTPRVGLSLDQSGGANQADGPATDINSIVAQYRKSGTLPNVAKQNPLYGDFTFGNDLHEIRTAMFEAEDRFMDLPASVREASEHDWVQFLALFDTEDGQKTLTDAGLIIKDPDVITLPIPDNENNDTQPPTGETATTSTSDGAAKPQPPSTGKK